MTTVFVVLILAAAWLGARYMEHEYNQKALDRLSDIYDALGEALSKYTKNQGK